MRVQCLEAEWKLSRVYSALVGPEDTTLMSLYDHMTWTVSNMYETPFQPLNKKNNYNFLLHDFDFFPYNCEFTLQFWLFSQLQVTWHNSDIVIHLFPRIIDNYDILLIISYKIIIAWI